MRAGRTIVVAVALTVVVGTLPMAVAALAPGSASTISVGTTVSETSGDGVAVAPGETVTVQVWTNATAVRGYQTNITFDPIIADIDSVAGSDDFDDPVTNVNNEAGWVAFNQLRPGETDDPVLAEITLTVPENASGSTQLTFVDTDTKLSDSDGETVTPEAYNSIELRVETGSSTPTDTTTPSGTDTPTATETATSTDRGAGNDTDGSDGSNDGDNNDSDDDNNDSDDGDNNGGGGGGGGAISPPEPSFSIINTSLNRTSAAPGQSVMVSGTIENDGDDDGTFEARVYDNGTVTGANASLEIPEGEQRQVNLTVRFNSSGVHAVKLNTTNVGNVTVRAANSTTNGTMNATRNETTNGTATATVSPTSDSTASATVTDTETATASQTAAQTTASDTGTGTTTSVSETRATTTDGSGPGFSLAAVVVSLSLLLGWLGYRRDGVQ
ncbi:cohesin domain-containing protein [Haloarcula japonica]|uniref:cohesin domain-containing protein n=1 Tax=Haloarcula japonica TaxID=29282 RepID=UPI0039F71C32